MIYLAKRYPHERRVTTRGTFAVPDDVAAQWSEMRRVYGASRPRNSRGYWCRPYPEQTTKDPYAPAGIYTDHRDPNVEASAYLMRDLTRGDQDRLKIVQHQFGLRHYLDAYNAVRNVGRRNTGENGRASDGTLVWRSYNTTWATHTDASGATQATSDYRQFGIELEFGHPAHMSQFRNDAPVLDARRAIERSAAAAGLDMFPNWGSWNLDMAQAHRFQACHDGTVTGAEIVSPIMDGDDASMNDVRAMIQAIRDNGGHAERGQGLHVHHNASDFAQVDRSRLVRNLRNVERAMGSYVYQPRTIPYEQGGTAHASAYTESYEWDRNITAVDRGREPHTHNGRYRFFNLEHFSPGSGCRIEFRGMGNSLNAGKIRVWIRVGQSIMAATLAGHEFPESCTVEQLLAGCREHGKLSEWASDRFIDRARRNVPASVAA